MGFNKPTWTPGHDRMTVSAIRSRRLAEVRERRAGTAFFAHVDGFGG
jgi:hypothetical protein